MNDALAAELTDLGRADNAASRTAMTSDDPAVQLAWRRVTVRHADRLAEIMAEHGWPTAALVGEEAARYAWLIAQHADRQLDVQRRALRLMGEAVAAGAASRRDLAFLTDRVLVNEGRRQVYGTQVAGVRDGVPVPWPVEDPDGMDRRRAEVGIEPFAVHTATHAPRSA